MITWPITDLPPAMITTGEYKGQGRQDWYLANFQKKLPQFEHQNIEMNFNRIFIELKKERPYCFSMGLKTQERVKNFSISRPYDIVTTPRLIMTSRMWETLGKPAEYSLEKLGGDPRYAGVVMTTRSYTEKLDKVIDELIKQNHLERKTVTSDSLIHMMKLNRVHYTVEYPWVLAYNQHSKDSNFAVVRIKEIDPFTYSYVYCPKNAWGEKMIKEINSVIHSSVNEPIYRQQMEKWQDKSSIDIIRKNYHLLVKQNP